MACPELKQPLWTSSHQKPGPLRGLKLYLAPAVVETLLCVFVVFTLMGFEHLGSVDFTSLLCSHCLFDTCLFLLTCVSVICLPETSGTKFACLKAAERRGHTNTCGDRHTPTQLKTEHWAAIVGERGGLDVSKKCVFKCSNAVKEPQLLEPDN